VAGFDLDDLAVRGTDPAEAMAAFDAWIARQAAGGQRPVFVAYPVAFDWMFVAYYFHRFLGRNPFGYAGLDVKSFYLGLTLGHIDAGGAELEPPLAGALALTHNALEDAVAQSRLFAQLLARGARS
jgi:DNA polymerase III epsilon subunit-like protein